MPSVQTCETYQREYPVIVRLLRTLYHVLFWDHTSSQTHIIQHRPVVATLLQLISAATFCIRFVYTCAICNYDTRHYCSYPGIEKYFAALSLVKELVALGGLVQWDDLVDETVNLPDATEDVLAFGQYLQSERKHGSDGTASKVE